jgi:NitT/TauT family transport system substrate-binding protein
MRVRTRPAASAIGLLIAAALLVAGCGGDDGGSTGGGPTKLTVQVLPISDVVPIYLGIEKGFFKEQNLRSRRRPPRAAPRSSPR